MMKTPMGATSEVNSETRTGARPSGPFVFSFSAPPKGGI
jgi:hypothetical protein